jgi:hypothetical protein
VDHSGGWVVSSTLEAVDPAGYVDGMNLYRVDGDNRSALADPSGLFPTKRETTTLDAFLKSVRQWEKRYPNKSACELLSMIADAYQEPNWRIHGGAGDATSQGAPWPYIYGTNVPNGGFIDVSHFLTSAKYASNPNALATIVQHSEGESVGMAHLLPGLAGLFGYMPPAWRFAAVSIAGYIQEILDFYHKSGSAFNPEDLPSDVLGAAFGVKCDCKKKLSDQLKDYFQGLGAGPDPRTAPAWRYLPPSERAWEDWTSSHFDKMMILNMAFVHDDYWLGSTLTGSPTDSNNTQPTGKLWYPPPGKGAPYAH